MRAVLRRDTGPELRLRQELHRRGLRYRVDIRPLPTLRRKADLVFTRAQVAVFVDGCFWHSCPDHLSLPKSNGEWWRSKLEGTKIRDADTNAKLRAADWLVIRVWEHEDPACAADVVEYHVKSHGRGGTPGD